jgi:hypothetical protein
MLGGVGGFDIPEFYLGDVERLGLSHRAVGLVALPDTGRSTIGGGSKRLKDDDPRSRLYQAAT